MVTMMESLLSLAYIFGPWGKFNLENAAVSNRYEAKTESPNLGDFMAVLASGKLPISVLLLEFGFLSELRI